MPIPDIIANHILLVSDNIAKTHYENPGHTKQYAITDHTPFTLLLSQTTCQPQYVNIRPLTHHFMQYYANTGLDILSPFLNDIFDFVH